MDEIFKRISENRIELRIVNSGKGLDLQKPIEIQSGQLYSRNDKKQNKNNRNFDRIRIQKPHF